jgi:precorrin-3B synthase
MVNLVSKLGADRIFKRAGIQNLSVPQMRKTTMAPFGFHELGDTGFIGLGAPFGRWSANGLTALADFAAKDGSGELRLTPWRAILLPGFNRSKAEALIAKLGKNFITRPNDPRLQISACTGMPSCRNATVNTHEDAIRFATLDPIAKKSGIRLHVSGCEKGCARPMATEAILVGRNGLYDLILNGKASDHPTTTGLDAASARRALEELWAGEAT